MSTPAQTEALPKRRGRSRQTRHQMIYGWGFALPFALLFVLVFVAPIVTAVRNAFFKTQAAGGGMYGGGESVLVFVGLENFIVTATNPAFWLGMGRVVVFGLIQIPIMIGLALILALLIDSFLVRRPGTWRLLYFLPYAIPGLIAAIVWGYMYLPEISPFASAFPPVNGQPFFLAPGIVLASMANMTTWTFTGYNMIIFLAALQSIPHDLYEAARLDGASGLKITTKIKIPLVRGAALLAVLLSIIGTIQLFNEPTVLKSLASWMPEDFTPMMMAYGSMFGKVTPSGAGPASAVSIMMALVAGVLAILYALAQRKAD